jgi:hypothetical protein
MAPVAVKITGTSQMPRLGDDSESWTFFPDHRIKALRLGSLGYV